MASKEQGELGLFGFGQFWSQRNAKRVREAQERHDAAFEEAADVTGFPEDDEE